jgi:hypothetical protein
MKPITSDNYIIRSFRANKSWNFSHVYLGTNTQNSVTIDLAVSPPAFWTTFDSGTDARNPDGIYQKALFASVQQIFYTGSRLEITGSRYVPIGAREKLFYPTGSQFYVVNVAQSVFGEGIRRGSFSLGATATEGFITTNSSASFLYTNGDSIGRLSGSFIRNASASFYNSANQVQMVGPQVLRDAHYISGSSYTLLEPASTNLIKLSQELDNTTGWAKSGTSVSGNFDIAPDGTQTADRLIENAATGTFHNLSAVTTIVSGNAFVAVSVFAKAQERNWLRIKFGDVAVGVNAFNGWFDLSSGSIVSSSQGSGSIFSARMDSISGSWKRCIAVGSVGNNEQSCSLSFWIVTGSGASIHDGTGTGSLSLWGAQVENDFKFATSYIATSASAVQRVSEFLSFGLPPQFITPQTLTSYIQFVDLGISLTGSVAGANPRIWQIVNGNNTGSIRIVQNSSTLLPVWSAISNVNGLDTTVSQTVSSSLGTVHELRAVFPSTGSITLGHTQNSSTESISSSSVTTLPMTWQSAATIHVAHSANGAMALKKLYFSLGSQTLSTMQNLVKTTNARIIDDGFGRLISSVNTSSILGNIFYNSGIAIIKQDTGSYSSSLVTDNGLFLTTGSQTQVQLNGIHTIYEHQVICTVEPGEFNFSTNPTLRNNVLSGSLSSSTFTQQTGSTGVGLIFSGTLSPYFTTVGLYDDQNQLVAVAKMARPIKRVVDTQQTVIIRFDA